MGTGTSGFSDLPTALLCDNSLGQPSSNIISSNSNDDPEDKSTSIISLDINLEDKELKIQEKVKEEIKDEIKEEMTTEVPEDMQVGLDVIETIRFDFLQQC